MVWQHRERRKSFWVDLTQGPFFCIGNDLGIYFEQSLYSFIYIIFCFIKPFSHEHLHAGFNSEFRI